jgi:hypothetical protein
MDGDGEVVTHFQTNMQQVVSVLATVAAIVLNDADEIEVNFSGMTINLADLYIAMVAAENSLQPALTLRQLLFTTQQSMDLMNAAEAVSQILWSVARTRRCSIHSVVADMGMLKYMTGLTVEEFSSLFVLVVDELRKEFPKTPDKSAGGLDTHLTLRLLLYLTLQRLRHLTSFRFLQGSVGFSFGHLCKVMNTCEDVLLRCLEPYLRKPLLEELQHDADVYFRTKPIN